MHVSSRLPRRIFSIHNNFGYQGCIYSHKNFGYWAYILPSTKVLIPWLDILYAECRACFKIIRWNPWSTYRVDLFASRLMNRDGFFKKNPLFLEIVTTKKSREDPTRKKVGVSAPNPLKLCLWIRLKRVDSFDSLSRLFPAFLYFEYRLTVGVPGLQCLEIKSFIFSAQYLRLMAADELVVQLRNPLCLKTFSRDTLRKKKHFGLVSFVSFLLSSFHYSAPLPRSLHCTIPPSVPFCKQSVPNQSTKSSVSFPSN